MIHIGTKSGEVKNLNGCKSVVSENGLGFGNTLSVFNNNNIRNNKSAMKNLIIIIATIFLSYNVNAQNSFTTQVEGGIKGEANSIQPNIKFHSMNPFETVDAVIFDEVASISEGLEFTRTLESNMDDKDFMTFVNILSSTDEHLLKVGHKVGKVKAHNASSIAAWFGNDANFIGQDISSISVTYSNVSFEYDEATNWTDFQYEVTFTVHTNELTAKKAN